MTQDDLFRPRSVQLAETHRANFTDEFLSWLPKNTHIYDAFAREAVAIRSRGFNHYSARTIIEFLRHHASLRQNPISADEPWNLNDHYTPYLARLFMLDNPSCDGLFEFRKTKKAYSHNFLDK